MKKTLAVVFSVVISVVQAQVLWQINKDTIITYNYLDGDEFSGTEISKDKWNNWYGWGRCIVSNKEQQYYTEQKNVELKNNALYITVKQEDVEARLVDWMRDNDSVKSGKGEFQGLNKRKWKYTSGMIQSKKRFHKGYYEIKFKAPSDKGLWPAFWLYGAAKEANYNEEIDMMELKGERESQTHVDTHCRNCDKVRNPVGQKRSFGGWIKLNGKLNEGFNVVSCLWSDSEVRYYVNGKCIAVSKVAFDGEKLLAINVAVADDNGPFHPGPDKSDKEFEPFIVDYVRVWTKNDEGSMNVLKVDDVNPQPDYTEAKRSPKMLYGKKKEHINDGIFISLLRLEDGNAKLFCNGLDKEEAYKLKVTNGSETLLEQNVSEREFIIPYAMARGTKVEIMYKGKSVSKTFNLTR